MITDIISLNIAYVYLSQIQQSVGDVTDIELVKTAFTDSSRKGLPRFSNLAALKSYININAPLVPFNKLDCGPISLYEVKALNVIGADSTKNFFTRSDSPTSNFVKKSTNTGMDFALEILNKSYMPEYLKILNQFNKIRFDEYILIQYEYIDCGYINTFFAEDYANLETLYKKYKRN